MRLHRRGVAPQVIGVVPAWWAAVTAARDAPSPIALTTASARWQSRDGPCSMCSSTKVSISSRAALATSQDRARARASPRPSRRPRIDRADNRARSPEVVAKREPSSSQIATTRACGAACPSPEQGFDAVSPATSRGRRRAGRRAGRCRCATGHDHFAFFRPVSRPRGCRRVPPSLEPNTFHPAFDARARFSPRSAVERSISPPPGSAPIL